MNRRLPQVAVLLVALAVGAAGAAVLATGPASAQATSIESCTVIDEPGQYVLTSDVSQSDESGGACIEIRASDVVLDGDGHAVDGNGDGVGVGTAGETAVENVSVVDLTVRESLSNIRFDNVTDGRLANVTSRSPDGTGAGVVVTQSERVEIRDSDLEGGDFAGPAVELRDSADVTVADNTFASGARGVDAVRTNRSTVEANTFADVGVPVAVQSGSANAIANNTIEQRPQVAIDVGGRNNTVTGNAIELANDGINVSGSGHTVAANDVSRIDGWAASAYGSDHTFVNNSFGGGDGVARTGGALRLAGFGHEVASNDLDGVHGVYVQRATGPIRIHHNQIDGTYQVRVAETELCLPGRGGAAAVQVRANAFTVQESSDDYYGILNEDDTILTATGNYWGAENGPSSPAGENVSDPMTGTAADGDGAPVSSGVHFDPWLGQAPANQSAG